MPRTTRASAEVDLGSFGGASDNEETAAPLTWRLSPTVRSVILIEASLVSHITATSKLAPCLAYPTILVYPIGRSASREKEARRNPSPTTVTETFSGLGRAAALTRP